MKVKVIGAGLAGSEASYQLAKRGIEVDLYEMRPVKNTPAHKTENFAELVCSNSLRAANIENAVGLLKEEMRRMDSLIMKAADMFAVPAGGALAVDRVPFSQYITDTLKSNPLINVIHEEITELPKEGLTVLATGPLTSEALASDIAKLSQNDDLYFYDAAAPIINLDSIDQEKGYWASRYDKGDKDYFNCPLTKEEYEAFYEALIHAEVHPAKDFEKEKFFEGCMPVEVLAYRGPKTLLFGPMKPVGLDDPKTGRWPYAVVQLRQDNAACTLMNMVGFQTRLTRPEQRRVFSMIPALKNAEFARYGMVHRNTFMNSPTLMMPTGQLKPMPHIFAAGQMTGVEGYVESAAQGLAMGVNASRVARGKEPIIWPIDTAMGALTHYICTTEAKHFQPMNITFGIMPELPERQRDKKLRAKAQAERALASLERLIATGDVD